MKNINDSQKKLLSILLPIIAIIVLFLLPQHHSRGSSFSSFILIIATIYGEIILFNKEIWLSKQTLKIYFPVLILLSIMISTKPYIKSSGDYYYPPKPSKSYSFQIATCNTYEHVKRDAERVKRYGDVAEWFTDGWCTPKKLKDNQQIKKDLDKSYNEKVNKWKQTRSYIPLKRRVSFRYELIDSKIAVHWLFFVTILGFIIFRVLSKRT